MIRFDAILWDDPADPLGNVRHVAAHGLTAAEVESALRNPRGTDGRSASSGRHMRFGRTDTGKHIAVAYKVRQTRTMTVVVPITAYEVPPH